MNFYSIILLLTATINLVLAVFIVRQITSRGAPELCFLLLALTLYSLGYAFELSSDNLNDILFWLKIEYIGISFLPVLLILLALHFTGKSHFIKVWMLIILLSLCCITLTLQYSNFNQLFYKEFRINNDGPFTLAAFSKGTWYWIHQIYINAMLLVSCILYLRMATNSKRMSQSRAVILLIASVIPWGFYLVYLTGNTPYHIDIVPFSFSFVGILYVLGILRYQLHDFFPLILKDVFESLPNEVILLDKKKRLVGFNRAAANTIPVLTKEMTGSPVELINTIHPALSDLIQKEDHIEAAINIIQEHKIRQYNANINPITRKRGKLLGYTIVLNEITEIIEKEKELIEKEKNLRKQNLTKDKLLAIVAHDLRNPFHIMINLSKTILKHTENGDLPNVSKTAQILHNTSRTTYNLLQNLLEWAVLQKKGMRLNRQPLKIKELVEDEIHELKHFYEQKFVTIKHEIPSQLFVNADEQMIRTVLRNLILNAIKYSYSKNSILVSAKKSDSFILFEIQDKGIGMTKEEQLQLFGTETTFTKKGTASEAGTGLGLILCQEMIQLHGGAIRVKSEPGKGSTFSFTLPVKT